MLDLELLKKEYPHIEDTAYFNSSAVSLAPERVKKAVASYLDILNSDFCHSFNDVHAEIDKAGREEIAKLIEVSPEEIAFTKNTCDGITLFANAYPFQTGDNVIITNMEYPSNYYPWLALEEKGVEIRIAEFHDHVLNPEDILKLADEHTKVVSLCAVFFATGFRFDLETLGSELHRRGILLVCDSIQGLGRLRVLPKKMHIDVLANGGHKNLLGMKGIGFLYVDRALLPKLRPYTACRQSLKRWHRPPQEKHYSELPWREDAQIFEFGNPNYLGVLAMQKGVSLLNELGPDAIEKHVLELDRIFREKVKDLPFRTISFPEDSQRSGILFFTLPEGVTEKAADEILVKHGVYATVREGYIRFAIHCMNTEKHIDMTVEALKEIAGLRRDFTARGDL